MSAWLSTIITSAVVATVVNAAINAWLESRKLKHATRLDALSAAVALEGYALTCAGKISDHHLAESAGGHAGAYFVSLPSLPELSVAAGFLRPRKAEVANRLMIFPQEAKQAGQFVEFCWDVSADIEQMRAEAVKQTAQVGLKALDLARDMRKAFRLPVRDLVFEEFNVRRTLEDCAPEPARGPAKAA